MADEALKQTVESPEQDEHEDGEKRGKSTIQFPYYSLEEAVNVAMGVHGFGNSCHTDQLAAALNQPPKSGSFRLKLLAAKLFGLLTYTMGSVSLTQLGSRICDPQQEQAARVEAFLLVPLYQRLHDQYRGVNLPPASGLETTMVNMGVVQKQKGTARQVFQRSAQYAGFFWSGAGRLVRPPATGATGGAAATTTNHEQNGGAPADAGIVEKPKGGGHGGNGSGGSSGGDDDYHPFIVGLLRTLPPNGDEWPMDGRRKWLLAASNIFELIYKDSDSKGSLCIEVQKDSSK